MKLPITACLIVKNEEKNLPLLLDSIKGLFQEIIVIDTGSTDKTKEIASKYTPKIYNFEWRDDFSQARNFCLAKATQEWILCLDADFIFLESSIIELKKAINNPDYQIFNINCIEYDGIIHPLSFLFKNNLGIKFVGSIHEQLSFDKKLKKGNSEIYVSHHGYLNEETKAKKSTRNRKIIDNSLLNTNDILNEIRFKIYQFYNEIENNTLNNEDIIIKIKELDEKINNLTYDQVERRKQLFESFYIFSFKLLNITLEEKINILKKLLLIFPTSLNLLYQLANLLFEISPYDSIKTLYLAYYIVKNQDASIYHYATTDTLKNKDFIFSEIIKKYQLLGDYKALNFWKKNLCNTTKDIKLNNFQNLKSECTECTEQSRLFPPPNYDFISDSIFEYLKIAREFCYLNIFPEKALFFYEKAINSTENECLKNLVYSELLLNYSFLKLTDYKIADLIEKITFLSSKNSYSYYCLGKYYKSKNEIEKAIDNYEQGFLMEVDPVNSMCNEKNSILFKESNASSYEYLRIVEELKILAEEGFLS